MRSEGCENVVLVEAHPDNLKDCGGFRALQDGADVGIHHLDLVVTNGGGSRCSHGVGLRRCDTGGGGPIIV